MRISDWSSDVCSSDLRCPNHGWRFGPDGRCNQIPYSTMPLPQTLGIKAWQLEERAGCIFAWHDPEGGDPTYDLPLFQERSEEHTSELQSLMRISYAVFGLKKKTKVRQIEYIIYK